MSSSCKTTGGRSKSDGRSGILQIVNFENGNAAGAVPLVDDRCVRSGREGGNHRRFEIVRGRQLRLLDVELGTLAPVVVRSDQSPIDITQFQGGVGHCVGDPDGSERWASCTNQDSGTSAGSVDDE